MTAGQAGACNSGQGYPCSGRLAGARDLCTTLAGGRGDWQMASNLPVSAESVDVQDSANWWMARPQAEEDPLSGVNDRRFLIQLRSNCGHPPVHAKSGCPNLRRNRGIHPPAPCHSEPGSSNSGGVSGCPESGEWVDVQDCVPECAAREADHPASRQVPACAGCPTLRPASRCLCRVPHPPAGKSQLVPGAPLSGRQVPACAGGAVGAIYKEFTEPFSRSNIRGGATGRGFGRLEPAIWMS